MDGHICRKSCSSTHSIYLSTSDNMKKITLRILCSVHYTISDNKMNKRHSINEEQSMWLPNMCPCFLGWSRKHFICVSFVVFNTIYNFTLISPSNFYLALKYNFLSPTFISTCSASCYQHGLVNWRSDKIFVANRKKSNSLWKSNNALNTLLFRSLCILSSEICDDSVLF